MAVNINIRELTSRAFGLDQLSIFKVPSADTATLDEAEAIGLLGLPVSGIVTFGAITYEGLEYQPVTFLEPIITANDVYNVVKTQLNGKRKGTVKEYISQGDVICTIQTAIFGADANGLPSRQRPIAELTRIRKYFQTPVAKPIENKFLNALGVYQVVIEEFSPIVAASNVGIIPIEIRCVSDEPIELEEIDA